MLSEQKKTDAVVIYEGDDHTTQDEEQFRHSNTNIITVHQLAE